MASSRSAESDMQTLQFDAAGYAPASQPRGRRRNLLLPCPHRRPSCAYSVAMQRSAERTQIQPASLARTTEQVAHALRRLTDADLLRLEALARLRARGLPGGVAWSDLLNEAIRRALDGSRPWPP